MNKALHDVQVSMIGDGVDLIDLQKGVTEGVSFDLDEDNGGRCRPYFFSSTGHGTTMAKVLQQTFPRIELTVARVSIGKNSFESILDVR